MREKSTFSLKKLFTKGHEFERFFLAGCVSVFDLEVRRLNYLTAPNWAPPIQRSPRRTTWAESYANGKESPTNK